MMYKNNDLIKKIDDYGRVLIDTDEFVEYMLKGENVSNATLVDSDEYDRYMKSCDMFDEVPITMYRYKKLEGKQTPSQYLWEKSENWNIPKEYQNIDIVDFLSKKCKSKAEIERMALELEEFSNRSQINVLYMLIYLVNLMREKGIVWGIGRGSSVASFILYLIGINKINPLEFDIDHSEFFK